MSRLNLTAWMAIIICLLGAWCAAPAEGADWPMLGGNAKRTGWSPDQIEGPTVRKWVRSFASQGLACGNQPVVVDGRLYIGTMHGTLHAIDAQTGKDIWTRKLGGGILHSAAVVDSVVYVCATDGRLYALSSRDGQVRWTFQTGQALWNAPLVAGGKVYFGGRDGFFYAINTADGKEAWKVRVGGPILNSPALANGRVFFAGEDMIARCHDAQTGRELWRAKLYGVSCRSYHPVVAGDVVMFTTQPGLGKFGPVEVLLEAGRRLGLKPRQRIGADPRGPAESSDVYRAKDRKVEALMRRPDMPRKQLELVRKIQQQRPRTRHFFAFDVATGKEPWIAPICWQESCGGPGDPPIVSPDGKTVVVKFALMSWARRGDYAPYLRVGVLDMQTGMVGSIMDNFEHAKSPMWGMTHDEMARLTGSGGRVIHTRQGFPGFRGVVALDLKTTKRQVLADNIHFGHADIGPMNLVRLSRGQSIPPTLEYLPRGTGVFGGAGTYAASVVVDDTLFYIPGHEGRTGSMLIAWGHDTTGKGTDWVDPNSPDRADKSYLQPENLQRIRSMPLDWDMLLPPYGRCWPGDTSVIRPESPETFKARSASARQYAAAISRKDLTDYVFDSRLPSKESQATPALRKQLAQQVALYIGQGWAPLRFPDLMFSGWYFYDDPAEAFTILSEAYPHLDASLQADVRHHLQKRFQTVNPLIIGILGHNQGARRAMYDLPIYVHLWSWNPRPRKIERLYPIWQWAATMDQFAQVRPLWEKIIRPMIQHVSPLAGASETLEANALISGVIAYARLAREFKDSEAEKWAADLAIKMLRQRIEAERTYIYTKFISRRPKLSCPVRYLHLNRTLAALTRDHAIGQAESLFARYIAHHRPTWYMAWGPMFGDFWERSIEPPTAAWTIFGARAMLFGDKAETLERYLDIPSCQADPYYIHKLSLTASAGR